MKDDNESKRQRVPCGQDLMLYVDASDEIRQRAQRSCSAHLNDLEIFLKNS